jgi:hypothetical protein
MTSGSQHHLLELDLRQLPADLGSFDYVIAHGFYSWIPADVRVHLMPLIARHLAPNGVAFVSYNTLPGCHMRRAVWDMIKYHTRDIADPASALAAARALLKLVGVPVSDENARQHALRAEVRDAAEGSDAALAHDDLAEPNDPVYFHELLADATRAGLTFLAEAHLDPMMGSGLATRQALSSSIDSREQYLDFIQFRDFSQSLLCHANALSQFVVQPSQVSGLHVLPSQAVRSAGASNQTERGADVEFGAIREFLLAQWPRSVSVAELGRWRAQTASLTADGHAARPIELLMAELYAADLVDLRTAPVGITAVPGERPEAFAAARWLSRERDVIPSLYHGALGFRIPSRKVACCSTERGRATNSLGSAVPSRDSPGVPSTALQTSAGAVGG